MAIRTPAQVACSLSGLEAIELRKVSREPLAWGPSFRRDTLQTRGLMKRKLGEGYTLTERGEAVLHAYDNAEEDPEMLALMGY